MAYIYVGQIIPLCRLGYKAHIIIILMINKMFGSEERTLLRYLVIVLLTRP